MVKQRTIRSRDRSERHATGLEFLLNNNEAEIIRSKAFILSFKSDFIPFEDNYATPTYNYKAGSQKDQMGSLRLNKERPLDIYIVINAFNKNENLEITETFFYCPSADTSPAT